VCEAQHVADVEERGAGESELPVQDRSEDPFPVAADGEQVLGVEIWVDQLAGAADRREQWSAKPTPSFNARVKLTVVAASAVLVPSMPSSLA
jgi:hypothetical protein